MKSSEKLIETIKQQDIRPMPGWYYFLKNGLLWASFGFAVLLGAMAFSVILFAIQQADFNVLGHLSHSKMEMFLGLLPFLWIGVLLLFTAVAFYSIRNSERGYKFTLAKQIGFSALLSILLGTLFFIGGGGRRLEQAFATNVSLYESIQERKVKIWSMPESGYLSGKITEVAGDHFTLEDFKGKSWEIQYGDTTFIAPIVQMEVGETIKLIGKMADDTVFKANEIRPWGGPGQRHRGRQSF
ncbi:MAG: hypothetical protein IPN76_30545 [Saprospiraceae bacterium]|nr:hypothetical protein [Saprospiraceae bacterium]